MLKEPKHPLQFVQETRTWMVGRINVTRFEGVTLDPLPGLITAGLFFKPQQYSILKGVTQISIKKISSFAKYNNTFKGFFKEKIK